MNQAAPPPSPPVASPTPKPPLSIIIPVLNDQDELVETVKSIRATAPMAIEIIIVDDGSETPAVVPPELDVRLFRNESRVGCAPSRHIGAGKAEAPHLLFIDSHMRFKGGWWGKLKKHIAAKPEAAWCCKCLGLSNWVDGVDDKGAPVKVSNMDVNQPKGGIYAGAVMNFDGPDPHHPNESRTYKQVFEGNWANPIIETGKEVPCMMGACYVVPKALFFKIGGLFGLRKWGSDEPYLSLKIWLSGGEILMAADVEIGHKFRTEDEVNKAPYVTQVWEIYFSKARSIMTLFNAEEIKYFFNRLEVVWNPTKKEPFASEARRTVGMCKAALTGEMPMIQADWAQNQALFKAAGRDLRWYCDRFKLRYPLDPEPVNAPAPEATEEPVPA